MATLPASSTFTATTVTEGGHKSATAQMRDYLAGVLGTAGTQSVALSTLGSLGCGVVEKTAAYTIVAADRGKVIDATAGTWDLTLTAAATLGDGFCFAIINRGVGTITINPNASEQINESSADAFVAGQAGIIVCDGAQWFTIAKTSIVKSVGPGLSLSAAGELTAGTITIGAPVDLNNQSSVTISNIPATAKRITVSGWDLHPAYGDYYIQIGPSGGVETTGYRSSQINGTTRSETTTRFFVGSGANGDATGRLTFVLSLVDPSTNQWNGAGMSGWAGNTMMCEGSKAISGALSKITFGTSTGAISGKINISWE